MTVSDASGKKIVDLTADVTVDTTAMGGVFSITVRPSPSPSSSPPLPSSPLTADVTVDTAMGGVFSTTVRTLCLRARAVGGPGAHW